MALAEAEVALAAVELTLASDGSSSSYVQGVRSEHVHHIDIHTSSLEQSTVSISSNSKAAAGARSNEEESDDAESNRISS